MRPMALTRTVHQPDVNTLKALAEVVDSLDVARERVELIAKSAAPELHDAANALAKLHADHRAKLEEIIPLEDALASQDMAWAEWRNRDIGKAVRPEAGVDTNPRKAILSCQRRLLAAFDDLMKYAFTDPLRGAVEHMKAETMQAGKAHGVEV
ncbi:MAG: hypothetical protein AAF744_14075 [Pseudomonadota bacterium]